MQIPLPLGFNPQQGFDDFHAGCNSEAVSHLHAFCDRSEQPFIYLWGAQGLGKTHLLNACCREAHGSGKLAAYIPLRSFACGDFGIVEGLGQFDLIALDDFDAVAGDAAWETAIFVLFNELRDAGRQLLIAANDTPSALPVALPDLRSRLGWGLTLNLQPLSFEDTFKALSLLASSLGLDLSEPVARYLVTRHHHNLGDLQNILMALDTATLAAQRKLTVPFIKRYLQTRGAESA